MTEKKSPYSSDIKGRTISEMLGVLAIVGILSVGALAGYKTVHNKIEENKVLKEAMRQGTELRLKAKHLLNASGEIVWDERSNFIVSRKHDTTTNSLILETKPLTPEICASLVSSKEEGFFSDVTCNSTNVLTFKVPLKKAFVVAEKDDIGYNGDGEVDYGNLIPDDGHVSPPISDEVISCPVEYDCTEEDCCVLSGMKDFCGNPSPIYYEPIIQKVNNSEGCLVDNEVCWLDDGPAPKDEEQRCDKTCTADGRCISCNTGVGFGKNITNKDCLTCKDGEEIFTAPNGKGFYCCPTASTGLVWDAVSYHCCMGNEVPMVIPSRSDSICCPKGTIEAVDNGDGINDYECITECSRSSKAVENCTTYGTNCACTACADGYDLEDGVCEKASNLDCVALLNASRLANYGTASGSGKNVTFTTSQGTVDLYSTIDLSGCNLTIDFTGSSYFTPGSGGVIKAKTVTINTTFAPMSSSIVAEKLIANVSSSNDYGVVIGNYTSSWSVGQIETNGIVRYLNPTGMNIGSITASRIEYCEKQLPGTTTYSPMPVCSSGCNCPTCPTTDSETINAPNGKGSACCPTGNTLAWDGMKYHCCGNGQVATVIPERDDSICCPAGTERAYWYENEGDFAYHCTPLEDGASCSDGKEMMEAPNGQGPFCCPTGNTLAWTGQEFQCCGNGQVSTLIPSTGDSICCPAGTQTAIREGGENRCVENTNTYCPEGQELMEAPKNKGSSCCPKGNTLAWDGNNFICCGDGEVATVIPVKDDSICCPAGIQAIWDEEMNMAYCGPEEVESCSADALQCSSGSDSWCCEDTYDQLASPAYPDAPEFACGTTKNKCCHYGFCCDVTEKPMYNPTTAEIICCPEGTTDVLWKPGTSERMCCSVGNGKVSIASQDYGHPYCCPEGSVAVYAGECISDCATSAKAVEHCATYGENCVCTGCETNYELNETTGQCDPELNGSSNECAQAMLNAGIQQCSDTVTENCFTVSDSTVTLNWKQYNIDNAIEMPNCNLVTTTSILTKANINVKDLTVNGDNGELYIASGILTTEKTTVNGAFYNDGTLNAADIILTKNRTHKNRDTGKITANSLSSDSYDGFVNSGSVNVKTAFFNNPETESFYNTGVFKAEKLTLSSGKQCPNIDPNGELEVQCPGMGNSGSLYVSKSFCSNYENMFIDGDGKVVHCDRSTCSCGNICDDGYTFNATTGLCEKAASCTNNTACGTNGYCSNGTCVECTGEQVPKLTYDGCETLTVCDSRTKTSCTGTGVCGVPYTCTPERCVSGNTGSGAVFAGGVCSTGYCEFVNTYHAGSRYCPAFDADGNFIGVNTEETAAYWSDTCLEWNITTGPTGNRITTPAFDPGRYGGGGC